jgi:L-erythro-3,5-diaminohexanoate dehydrogenase
MLPHGELILQAEACIGENFSVPMWQRKYMKADPFGSHRVIEPKGVLPQPAQRIDNSMDEIFDNEILVDVDTLNIDSASFTQIKNEADGDEETIKKIIIGIVADRGKMQNPVTGSGGMFIGTVNAIGESLKGKKDIKEGDALVSLVSLSLTPLRIDEILEVKKDVDQVRIKGQAILFESGIFCKMPDDIPAPLALAVLDVCGAPAQTAQLVKPGDTVAVIGGSGKSGILSMYEAKKQAGDTGTIIGIASSDRGMEKLKRVNLSDHMVKLDAGDALTCYNTISDLSGGKLADVVINCVNIPNTEMASILMCRQKGTVYFFSMATSFTKAALGAEGVGKDITMIIGNGYTEGHAEHSLNIIRECEVIRSLYEELYGDK